MTPLLLVHAALLAASAEIALCRWEVREGRGWVGVLYHASGVVAFLGVVYGGGAVLGMVLAQASRPSLPAWP